METHTEDLAHAEKVKSTIQAYRASTDSLSEKARTALALLEGKKVRLA